MRIAIQEDMLPGRSVIEKFEQAKALGVQGIEFWGRGIDMRVEQIVEAAERTGLKPAMLNHGRQGRILDPDYLSREAALEELRTSIMAAADMGAAGVVFVPHFYGSLMPDLSPWMTAAELEAEMLHMHFRSLSDYADAIGVMLLIEPVNHYESHLFNRLEQAAAPAKRINHPKIKIAADTFHMALEEADMVQAITDHAEWIRHVYASDNNRRLPGQGVVPFDKVAAALKAINYDGWVVLTGGEPGSNASRAAQYLNELPASLAYLRTAGF